MNRAELRTLASSFCEDPNLTKFTPAKYNDALEKAQQQFCLDGKCLYKTNALIMVVGTSSYDLPNDYILDKMVQLNGIKLQPISRNSLGELYKGQRWDTITGTPTHYISDPVEAQKKLVLFPIPDSDSYGTDIELTYYCLPTSMSSDSVSPFNNSSLMGQYHMAVACYASWLLLGFLTLTNELDAKRKNLLNTYTGKVNEAIQGFGDTKSEPLSLHPRDIRVR